MNVVDYILLGILAAFVVRGYVKGFFFQVLQLVGILLAFLLAVKFHTDLAAEAFQSVRERSETAALVMSFLSIFFAVTAVTVILASLASAKARIPHVKNGDSVLGALIGLAKGVLLLGGVALGVQESSFPEGALVPVERQQHVKGLITESMLIPRLTEGCLALVALIPSESRQEVARVYGQLHLDPPSAENRSDPRGTGDATATHRDPARPVRREMLGLGPRWRLNRQTSHAPGRPVPASGEPEEDVGDWNESDGIDEDSGAR